MQFGPVPLSDAAGAILAHSLRAGAQTLRKGRILSATDVAVLRDAGYETVIVARLDVGDVGEDAAAARIAAALGGDGIRIGAAFTGRANLYAATDGLLRLDAARLQALNSRDEAITVATLPAFARVAARQMVATVKIIPFAAPAAAVADAEALLRGPEALSLAPFRPARAALIMTTLPATRAEILARTRREIAARLAALGSVVAHEATVGHDTAALSAALQAARHAQADPILVFGASAITDRRDVIPAAVLACGGSITRFGMPVDPGNLLLLGRLGAATVVGLPGCARSPKRNGFDFVLERLLAGVAVGSSDIAAMGVGGLLTEIHTRPQPRDSRGTPAGPRRPAIAAVILAAGRSSRMGRNKLLVPVRGEPLIRRVAERALASAAAPVIVVTGNDGRAVAEALAGLSVSIVENPEYEKGLSTSLIAGINAVPEDCDGALVLLGDMPEVETSLLDRLVAAFDPEEGRAICVATHDGQRGNPVLWTRAFFAEIRQLTGDAGARALFAANEELVCEVEAGNDGPLVDLDTPEALAAYSARTR